MAQPKRPLNYIYRILDFLMAQLAWAGFFVYRKKIEYAPIDESIFQDNNFWLGIILIPTCWMLLYSATGQYKEVYRQSRLSTITNTFLLTFIGVVVLFFALVLDDVVSGYKTYYSSIATLFGLHFSLTIIPRIIIITLAKNRLKKGNDAFRTLLIGSEEKALEIYEEVSDKAQALGNHVVGYIEVDGVNKDLLSGRINKMGHLADLPKLVQQQRIEEAIIAIESTEHNKLRHILNTLFSVEEPIVIKTIPDMYDIMLGHVKMNHVYGAILIEIEQELMPNWQKMLKRAIDLGVRPDHVAPLSTIVSVHYASCLFFQ